LFGVNFEMKLISISFFYLFVFLSLTGCSSTTKTSSAPNPPIQSQDSCQTKYQYIGSSQLCKTYWTNGDTSCDSVIRQIIANRKENLSPEICGTPIRPNIPPCTNNVVASLSSKEICNRLNTEKNPQCSTNLKDELSSRDQYSTPHQICGTQNLSKLVKPYSDTDKCNLFINKIVSQPNFISSACNFRFNSLDDETILCRNELNQFINLNSEGVGTNSLTCGIRSDTFAKKTTRPFQSFLDLKSRGRDGLTQYEAQFKPVMRSQCELLAVKNDVDAKFCLALIDADQKKIDSFLKNLTEAANRGHPPSQYALAKIYSISEKPAEKRLSENLMQNAAIGGHPIAQVSWGWQFMNPRGNKKDYSKAMYWNNLAAEAGDGEAYSNIGMLYENGWGTKSDPVRAAEWYSKAVGNRYAWSGQAEVRLAQILQRGAPGVQRDQKRAVQLYQRVISELKSATTANKELAQQNLRKIKP
jgi:TPR repeat protein